MRASPRFQFVALVLIVAAAGAARAQDLAVPAEWAGVWEFETTQWMCGLPEFPQSFSFTDTLCTGEGFADGGDAPLVCTGAVVGNVASMECTGEMTTGDCTEHYTLSQTMTLAGDTFAGTGTMSVTYSGSCESDPPLCVEVELTATRSGGEPGTCSPQPAQAVTWGTLKGRYR